MRAAIFYSPNNIAIEEIKFANHFSNKENEVVLKVNSCGICGYDVGVFRNGHPKVTPPVILGHEICGEILETIITTNDSGSKAIKKGTRVVVSPIVPCLNCIYCHNKHYNLCINLKEIGSTIDGGFAKYIRIPKRLFQIGGLVPVPDNLSDEEAALLEPLACCLNGFYHIGPITKEEGKEEGCIVIIGDGPIGLLHLQLSKLLFGTIKTIVIGKIPKRIQKAKSLGADAVVLVDDNSSTEISDNILEFINGIGGANLVIVATSNPLALNLATKIAAKNCKINIFAGMPKESTISLDPNWFHYNQISITGSFSSTPNLLKEAVKLAANREIIDLSKIITHRYSLDKIHEALLATEKYYGLRAVINKF